MYADNLNGGSAPYPVEDLSPFVYRQEGQAEGFYYIPAASTNSSNSNGGNAQYYVASPLNADGSSGDYISTENPTPSVGEIPQVPNTNNLAATSTTPPVNTPLPTTPTTSSANTQNTTTTNNVTQYITSVLDNIVGINNITNDITNNSVDVSANNSGNTVQVSTSQPIQNDASIYTRPVIVGGLVGMVVAKLVKKDIFWGFIFGGGALSLYTYYRAFEVSNQNS